MSALRSASREASALLETVADQKRRSVRLPEDEAWVREGMNRKLRPRRFDGDVAELLQGMHERRSVYRVRKGRYVVAPRSSFTVQQAASAELITDVFLSRQGDYYLGFLSALIGHRLTDLHSADVFAVIRQESTFSATHLDLPSGTLHVIRLSASRWPAAEDELERVRMFPDSIEFAWRSSLERTLVDAINRPEYCAGIETVVSCWSAAAHRDVNWDFVCEIASRSESTMRRVAFLLRLIGQGEVAERGFPGLSGRGRSVFFDSSKSYAVEAVERDSATGVIVNVPSANLRGWATAG